MEHFLLFCLASAGMTSIVVKGTIFRPVRAWISSNADRIAHRREKRGLPPAFSVFGFVNDLISCVQCAGFWCGIFCGLFLVSSDYGTWASLKPSAAALLMLGNKILMLFCCGVAGSFSAMLGDVLFETLYFTKEYTARRLHEEEHHFHEEEPQQEEMEEVRISA